jgi:hypothetical protein
MLTAKTVATEPTAIAADPDLEQNPDLRLLNSHMVSLIRSVSLIRFLG